MRGGAYYGFRENLFDICICACRGRGKIYFALKQGLEYESESTSSTPVDGLAWEFTPLY